MVYRKRHLWVVLIIVLLLALLFIQMGMPPKDEKVKATWLWNTQLITNERERIVNFAQQNGINLIYLQIDRKRDLKEYRTFIQTASLSGIEVHALDGHPSWSKEAERHQITELVKWIEHYNEQASADQQLKGIHLDIEPYNIKAEWESDQRQVVIDGWLASMDHFISLTNKMKSIETGADLPFWLDEIPVSSQQGSPSIAQWMIEKLDHVTLMAYRDQAHGDGGILDAVMKEIEIANELNKKVIIGVETNQREETYTTFYDKGLGYKQEQLLLVEKKLLSHPSYHGIAVHDYVGWTQLSL